MSSRDSSEPIRRIKRLSSLSSVWAELTIRHPRLHPDQITATLDLQATGSMPRGEVIYNNDQMTMTADHNIWRLSSRETITSGEIENHLAYILDCLFGRLPAIRKLQDSGAVMHIRLWTRSWTRHNQLNLDVDTLATLAHLRLPLETITRYENTESDY